MFTGLVEDIGTLESIRPGQMATLAIRGFGGETAVLGESIAVNGVCLSVVSASEGHFSVQASDHTCRVTAIGHWKPGKVLQLERALKVGDRLGGHIVQGHVDCTSELVSRRMEGGSLVLRFRLPESLRSFVIPRSSIAVDGVSLTVSTLLDGAFEVTLIPDTQKRTALSALKAGEWVNLEADIIGKYVAAMLDQSGGLRPRPAPDQPGGSLTEASLLRAGFGAWPGISG